MASLVKRVLFALVIITVAVISGLFLYTNDRTYYNKPEELGNSAGNIYNGGLFCQQDDTIYFNYISDDGGLYSMNAVCENIKKITDKKAIYLNADKHYLYYVLASSTTENKKASIMRFSNSGIYRISQNGSGLKVITGDPSAFLFLKGDFLFSQRYNVKEGLTLYQNKIDGEEGRLLYKEAAVPAVVMDDFLYFVDKSKDNSISHTNLSSYTTRTALKGSYQFPIYMGDYIYYIDLNDHNYLYRMNKDGTDPTLLVNKPCSTYNITNTGNYLYYQISGTSKDRISRMNLETMKSETIKKGDYKHIHVTDNYVFFTDSKNKQIYKILAEGTTKASTFDFVLGATPTPAASKTRITPNP